jgi:hypothetical protein
VKPAKVFILKNSELGDPTKDWKVCLESWADLLVVVYDANTFEEAWEWLYANYKRDVV